MAKSIATLSIFAMMLMLSTTLATSSNATFNKNLETFSHKMFSEIVKSNGNANIIYSPISIQTCLTMARLGANGETATEMDHGLGYTGQNIEAIAENFHSVMKYFENSDLATLANKIYLQNGVELKDNYNDLLKNKFLSSAEIIDFDQNKKAAESINTWVESKTNSLIKNVVQPSDLSSNTRVVLLNAIHFKGNWLKPFDEKETKLEDFYVDEENAVQVPTMTLMEKFDIARLDEIDAMALRLPYSNSDLSMVIFLPNNRTGLADMQENLMNIELKTLTEQLRSDKVFLKLPKFQAELTIELTNILKNLGIHKMFDNGDFSNMLKSDETLSVSKAIHKAFIDVNEKGTEAAGLSSLVFLFKRLPVYFKVDHPFHYVIVNADNLVLFQGNVVAFSN